MECGGRFALKWGNWRRNRDPYGYAAALDRAAALGRRIPVAVRHTLRDLAIDDRAEAISHAAVNVIVGWRAASH